MAPTNDDEDALEPEKRGGGGLNARTVLHALKRRPFALLAVVVLAGAAGSSVRYFLPVPKATAAVVFQISAQAPVLLNPTAESRVDFVSYRLSQAAMLKRRLSLSNVLKQPTVQSLEVVQRMSDPVTWLDRALQIDARVGGEFMRVSLEGDNPDELCTILEAVKKVYLADVDERDNGTRRRRLAKLEETNRGYRVDVERAHQRIDLIAKSIGVKDGQTLALMDSMLRDDLRAADRELRLARGTAFDEDGGGVPVTLPGRFGQVPLPASLLPVSPAEIEEELRRNPAVAELEAGVIRAQQALTDTKDKFAEGTSSPSITKAEENLRAAIQKRDKFRAELRGQIEAAQRKRFEFQQQYTKTRQKDKEEWARAEVAKIQKKIADWNDYRSELEKINALIGQTEKLSARIADEIEQIKIELGAPSRVTVSEEPYVVPGLEGNRRVKYTLIAALGVLGAGFAAVVLWEHRSRRVTHPDDVTALGIRLIGSVPAAEPSREADRLLVEAVDTTRTMLLHGTPGVAPRVVLVTSAVSGEGKTSLSGHLAISLARAGFRTLLIDGDLRAPTAQRVFQLPLSPGLCEFLHGETAAADVARPTGVPGLSVMTAGAWTVETRQALAGGGWRGALDQLRATFDFVVVDTSPLLLVSDTLLMAREADGVVVSVLLDVSRVALVAEAVEKLQMVRARVTGAVASGVRSAALEYTQGYGPKPAPLVPELPATPAR